MCAALTVARREMQPKQACYRYRATSNPADLSRDPRWNSRRKPHASSESGPGLFSGSFDWHSAVHAHWALLSIARVRANAELEAWLSGRLTDKALRAEHEFLRKNSEFEQPYGRAWLLLLLTELGRRSRTSTQVRSFHQEIRESLLTWLECSSFPEQGNATAPRFRAQHQSWLFAYMLLALTDPTSASIRAQSARYARPNFERARSKLAAVKQSSEDFLFLPAVQAVVDRVDATARGKPPPTLSEFRPLSSTHPLTQAMHTARVQPSYESGHMPSTAMAVVRRPARAITPA